MPTQGDVGGLKQPALTPPVVRRDSDICG